MHIPCSVPCRRELHARPAAQQDVQHGHALNPAMRDQACTPALLNPTTRTGPGHFWLQDDRKHVYKAYLNAAAAKACAGALREERWGPGHKIWAADSWLWRR